jgi:hypothetical protein
MAADRKPMLERWAHPSRAADEDRRPSPPIERKSTAGWVGRCVVSENLRGLDAQLAGLNRRLISRSNQVSDGTASRIREEACDVHPRARCSIRLDPIIVVKS